MVTVKRDLRHRRFLQLGYLGEMASGFSVFRKLEGGEMVLVKTYAELEEAKQVVALFNENWPGEYCIRGVDTGIDAEEPN